MGKKIMTDKLSIGQDVFYVQSMLSVGNITFIQRDQPPLRYSPMEDITPYELSLLLPLFAIATSNRQYGDYNFWGYIEKHNLMRHFDSEY